MTKHKIRITGMPYFPGVAVAKLHKGLEGEVAQRVLLITQDEVLKCHSHPVGFIVVESVPFSHAMIGLLELGLPTVLISGQQAALLEQDMELVIDGNSGLISNDLSAIPSATDLVHQTEAGKPVMMADGEAVNLLASVRQAAAASNAKAMGAEAIGLVRSEYLLPSDDAIPDEAFYTRTFRRILEAASPLPVTFRLLDLAASKIPPWLAKSDKTGQAQGMQGVRLYYIDAARQVVDAQLAALSALAMEFSVRVLLPFLTRLEEFEYWLDYVQQRLPNDVAVGAMAETPAMILDIGHLSKQADFVAIGCNDLMQCLYAADRDRSELRYYLDPYAPLLYRFFRQAAEQSGEHVNQIQLCGVLPQIQGVLAVLLGLGYRTFSVDGPSIPYLAKCVVGVNRFDCRALALEVCEARTTREVLNILRLPTDRQPPFLDGVIGNNGVRL